MSLDKRTRKLNSKDMRDGRTIYWMQRDQRCEDNWALTGALLHALRHNQELEVLFCLTPQLETLHINHLAFLLHGLYETGSKLGEYGVRFSLLSGKADVAIIEHAKDAATVFSDFSPLKEHRNAKKRLADALLCPLFEVDAHNIIPSWQVSQKCEFSAHTFRTKYNKLIDEYLEEKPLTSDLLADYRTKLGAKKPNNIVRLATLVETYPINQLKLQPGTKAAHKRVELFLAEKISTYDQMRNDPNEDATSRLSPYLNFGHISARTIVDQVLSITDPKLETDIDAFYDQLVIRRELADNFCLYNQDYDSIRGAHPWAQKTLDDHRSDPREYEYQRKELEAALTHEKLWNAAQRELVQTGNMHNYMRMYWAKKILEWSPSPEIAFANALYLNDTYSLDGRDPNGYTGVAWSIAGVHDRAWSERPVFGKIRYMNYNGCKRKFDVEQYIHRYTK